MDNKLSVGGIFTLSVNFQASLNLEAVFIGTTDTPLNVFGLSVGTKRLTVAVMPWLELCQLWSSPEFPAY